MTTTTGEAAAGVALGVYLAGLGMVFGVRMWSHRRTTGGSGFRGLSGRPGSGAWWGGVLFVAALALTMLGLVLALVGVVPAVVAAMALPWVGLAAAVAGLIGVVAAQRAMGASWRIGVDTTERTRLVTDGLFAFARNPVFTGMCLALGGLTAMAPTVLTGAGLVCLVVAVQLQVCLAPGLMEALNPGEDESHGSIEEVPRGASGASDPVGGRSAA